jgi:hypothetical protein
MRTITYNDEAAPWSRSGHVLGSRLLLSREDRNKNFSITFEEQGLR